MSRPSAAAAGGVAADGGLGAEPIGCCSPTQSVWACFNINRGHIDSRQNHVVNKPLWLLGTGHGTLNLAAVKLQLNVFFCTFVFLVTVFFLSSEGRR